VKHIVGAYLARLDAHLAGAPAFPERLRLLEEERSRVDRLERALSEWASRPCGGARAPTRFSAFDFAVLHGELSLRLAATRRDSKGLDL
jgi:hypothetical protein